MGILNKKGEGVGLVSQEAIYIILALLLAGALILVVVYKVELSNFWKNVMPDLGTSENPKFDEIVGEDEILRDGFVERVYIDSTGVALITIRDDLPKENAGVNLNFYGLMGSSWKDGFSFGLGLKKERISRRNVIAIYTQKNVDRSILGGNDPNIGYIIPTGQVYLVMTDDFAKNIDWDYNKNITKIIESPDGNLVMRYLGAEMGFEGKNLVDGKKMVNIATNLHVKDFDSIYNAIK